MIVSTCVLSQIFLLYNENMIDSTTNRKLGFDNLAPSQNIYVMYTTLTFFQLVIFLHLKVQMTMAILSGSLVWITTGTKLVLQDVVLDIRELRASASKLLVFKKKFVNHVRFIHIIYAKCKLKRLNLKHEKFGICNLETGSVCVSIN